MKLDNFIKYALSIFIALTVSRMFREMYWLYYATQLILLLFILIAVKELWQKKLVLNKKTIQMFGIVILFPVWTALTAFWSINPLTTFLKGMNFVFVVTGLFSALLLWVNYENGNFFKLFLPANLFIVLTSIFSLVTGIPNDAWDIGHGLSFAGFFGHQNVMGMALMFTLPGVFGLLEDKKISFKNDNNSSIMLEEQSTEKTKKAKQKYFFFIILTLNLFLIVITYSRSVILSLFIGVLVYLIITKAYKLLTGIGGIIALGALLYFTITPVNQTIYKVASKHGWDILATRTYLWEPSFEAAKLGGMFGIGFGNSNPAVIIDNRPNYNEEKGIYFREKGNSTLAVIEETGIVGILLYFIPILYVLNKIFSMLTLKKLSYANHNLVIIFTFLIMFLIHSNFEAWFTAAGSTALPMFLLLLISGLIWVVNPEISGKKAE